jgi:cytochrome P450
MSTIAPPPGTTDSTLAIPSTKGHARMRRNLNHGFSDKALRDQEPRIMKYIKLLIKTLRDRSEDNPIDMSRWYNFTMFDIIGEFFPGNRSICLRAPSGLNGEHISPGYKEFGRV